MFKTVVSVIRKSILLDNFFKTFMVKEVKVVSSTFTLQVNIYVKSALT